ncbi:MAG: ABC transporter ATP-binding protein [Clostridia bacterium]|nr:ABC transporter ATP-binding protein [Clostridia bacterium]
MTDKTLLKCDKLSLSYEGKIVLENLSFELNEGDYLCIVGENGSGKSSLIKALLGLKRTASGKIITGRKLRHNEIGYLPQQTSMQRDFPASVKEVVMSGFLNRKKFFMNYTSAEKRRAQEILEILSITDLADRCYRDLSGGQQQRVLLARALCATSKMLLLDEPVAGLDPMASEEMYRLIRKVNREEGITIVMVTHDIHCAIDHASHIMHLNAGQLIFYGTAEDYRNSDIGRAFLEEGTDEECMDCRLGRECTKGCSAHKKGTCHHALKGEPHA